MVERSDTEATHLTFDPVTHPPSWYKLVDGFHVYDHPIEHTVADITTVIFGHINGFGAMLFVDKGEVTFLWGCRRLMSELGARAHWPGNHSIMSGAHRPHAQRLISWVSEICQSRGWAW